MGYGEPSVKEPEQSLMREVLSADDRIRELFSRLTKLHDHLFGASLQPVDAAVNKPPSSNSVRRTLEMIHTGLSECESRMNQIENKI